jgi:MOSC domain-containing protein YiiM
MRVLSINQGRAEPIADAKASGITGIYKRPCTTTVTITPDGIVGDTICDTEKHGGPDQAIYIYGTPDYAWWSSQLGVLMEPGTFGENITITDLESATLVIGDRFHLGSVTLEVTAPRIPCITLARRMGDPAFVKTFRFAERPGVYCRVIHAGTLQQGDRVQYEPYAGPPVSAIELFRDFFTPRHEEHVLRRHLAAPIAIRTRRDKEQQLAKLLGQYVQSYE